jgi:hypothetical protein
VRVVAQALPRRRCLGKGLNIPPRFDGSRSRLGEHLLRSGRVRDDVHLLRIGSDKQLVEISRAALGLTSGRISKNG